MDQPARTKLIQEHLDAISKLEREAATSEPSTDTPSTWPPQDYYLLWHIVVGMVLGTLGATVSLGFNVAGSLAIGQHPLKLIQVFLTFPMGQQALESSDAAVLFVGCILYLTTGSLYGLAFHLVMSTLYAKASFVKRFMIATLMGVALWLANFYLILSWLQPMLLGDNWILRLVPPWVAALTHLSFTWSMLLFDSRGQRFEWKPSFTS